MPSNGTAIAAGMIGAGLLWSALFNKSLLNTAKDVVSGKKPQPGPEVPPPTVGNALTGLLSSGSGIPGVTVGIPAGVAAGSASSNEALGQQMAAAVGWTGVEWEYLRSGWAEESGWSTSAAYDHSDPYNHAYGIPQSNPGTKMASAGADWKTNPATQIKWGIAYIQGRYGSPSRVPGWSPNGPLPGYQGY